jgi:hypothetical protein
MVLFRRFLAVLGAGLTAAAITGLAFGIIWRVLMRGIALVQQEPTEFSLEGSFGIVLTAVVTGLPGALVLAALIKRRFIGYLVAALGLSPLNVMMIYGQAAFPERPLDVLHTVAFYTLCATYLAVIEAQVVVLGRVSPWLRRRFGPMPAATSAQP